MSLKSSIGFILFALSAAMARADAPRPVIYQLLVRTFGNANSTNKPGGSIGDNGCGKFADINDAALQSLKELGITHVWLTGVMEQASATAYPGRPADDPDILKGMAGSPYAIKDYFDVSPDYAVDPAKRMEEFRAVLQRCHAHGLKVMIDFVPNHVSRAYASDVMPDLSFGSQDRRGVFFHRDNHFYYLGAGDAGGGPPLRLPETARPGCDGLFAAEKESARVTGNNVVSWAPGAGDWYETIKLNYGIDFTKSRDWSYLPGADTPPGGVPDTWRKMDRILAWWQDQGVDGFRVDMAHMVPMRFWEWATARARARAADVYFMAEAYDNDPAKLTEGNVLEALLAAGFHAVYDDASYDLVHDIYTGPKWANDFNKLASEDSPLFHRSLRYAENHDEVRLANPGQWGGHGAAIGRPVSALLFCLGKGPIMLYHGQEVGEEALGAEGYGKDDGRTTIFDYWSLPGLQKWHNKGACDGGGLTPAQRDLRAWYASLLAATAKPAFTGGGFYGLNHANAENPDFGRIPGESASGHWLYVFLRRDPAAGKPIMVVINLHPTQAMAKVKIRIPTHAANWLGLSSATLDADDLLNPAPKVSAPVSSLATDGLPLPDLPAASVMLLEIK